MAETKTHPQQQPHKAKQISLMIFAFFFPKFQTIEKLNGLREKDETLTKLKKQHTKQRIQVVGTLLKQAYVNRALERRSQQYCIQSRI